MSLATAFVALSLLSQQGTKPVTPPAIPFQDSGIVVEGKPVNLIFPAATPATPPADLLAWRGWGYLNGSTAQFASPFVVGYDWTKIQEASKASLAVANPLAWRAKFVILERTENLFRGPDGVLRADRRWTPDRYLRLVQESVARLAVWVSAETGGKVRLVPEITVERELLRPTEFGADFARRYFGPRMNGGGYEAEDKVFRGPYHSAFYIMPGAASGPAPATWVNGTPVTGVPLWQVGTLYAPGDLDVRLHEALRQQVDLRLGQRGARAVAGEATTEGWAEATNLAEVPTATLLERLKSPLEVRLGLGSLEPTPVTAWRHDYNEVTLATDPEKGQVLQMKDTGAGRNAGFALPERSDGQPLGKVAEAPTLSLSVKTDIPDRIGLTILGNGGKRAFVTLGREVNYRPEPAPGLHSWVPFKSDNTWQRVNIDLKSLAAAAGFDTVVGLRVEPTPMSVLKDRQLAAPIIASFDDFRFTSEAATPASAEMQPNATSADAEERALFAAKATQSSPELLALLADRSDLVRLNAADAFTRIKDEKASEALLKIVGSIDPSVGATAVKALAFQGGDVAIATARRLVAQGMTPFTRETAARVLAATKDPKYGNDFKILMTDHSRTTRVAAVESLAALYSKENAIFHMAFLAQEDPDITLAVTETANPADEYQMRKLLWSAVNEPSDMVRAASDIKLISSPKAEFKAEGYKGVRDDSRATRLAVLEYLAATPDEAHRGALRLAVTDRSAEVRAAAIRGFAALEKGAEPDEIANVLEDRHPLVQLALIDLAKRRGFKLPPATRTNMETSPDPRVRDAVKELPA